MIARALVAFVRDCVAVLLGLVIVSFLALVIVMIIQRAAVAPVEQDKPSGEEARP